MEELSSESSIPRTSPPVAVILAGAGGILALIGVFLHWARLTSSFEGFRGDVVGVAGTFHWTGILALLAAVVAIAATIAMVVVQNAASRRTAAVAALAGGAVALLSAILGFVMSESIVLSRVPRGAIDFRRALAEQLGVQGFGIEFGPGLGVFVTAIGGAVAAVGGFMALSRPGPQPARIEKPQQEEETIQEPPSGQPKTPGESAP